MSEPDIGGHTYSIGKLDAFLQFHVVRRLGPLVADAALAVRAIKSDQAAGREALLRTVLADLSKLPEDDANYVLKTCLGVVTRKRAIDNGWDKILAPTGALMFPAEIDMSVMLQIVWHVLMDNLASFLNALPSDLAAPGQGQGAPSNLSRFPTTKIG